MLFYNALRHGMDYIDPGASYYETRYRERVVKNLHRRAKAFGFVLQAADISAAEQAGPPSGERRRVLMDAVAALAPGSGLIAAACTALGLSRASLHRRQAFRRQPLGAVRPRPTPMRALVAKERQVVLDLLREPRFVDLAPAEVYASLLDQGLYLCSIRTMYRILAEHDEVRERRRQLRRPVYQKPELLAETQIRFGPGTSRS